MIGKELLNINKMEKKFITKNVKKAMELTTDWGSSTLILGIDDLLGFLLEAKEAGAEKILFNGETEYYDNRVLEYLSLQPTVIELESDDDFSARLIRHKEQERLQQMQLEEQERKQLEELLKKYGK